MKQHFQQIDVLKCAAIVAVIALHSLSKAELISSYAIYHIWQAVPVFMVLMGLNLGLSLQKKQEPSISTLYTKTYFSKKATRILLPFFMVFVASLLLGLFWQAVYGKDVLTFNAYTFVGLLPITGRGNYFITLLLQSVLVLPLLGFCFKKWPVLTTVGCLLLETIFLVCSKNFGWFTGEASYLYSAALPRYFSALVYGLWLSKIMKHRYSLAAMLPFAILGVLGSAYLYLTVYTNFTIPFIYASWQSQNLLSFGYAALVILLFLYLLPANSGNPILVALAQIGHASYHIFLVQVVYFGLPVKHDSLLLNELICLLVGYLFYRAESAFSKRALSRKGDKQPSIKQV